MLLLSTWALLLACLTPRCRALRPTEEKLSTAAPTTATTVIAGPVVNAQNNTRGEQSASNSSTHELSHVNATTTITATTTPEGRHDGACQHLLASSGSWTPSFDYRKVANGILQLSHGATQANHSKLLGTNFTGVAPELNFTGNDLAMFVGADIFLNDKLANFTNGSSNISTLRSCSVDPDMLRLSLSQSCEEVPERTEVEAVPPTGGGGRSFRLRLAVAIMIAQARNITSNFEIVPVDLRMYICVKPSVTHTWRPLHLLWFYLSSDRESFSSLYANKTTLSLHNASLWNFSGYQHVSLKQSDPTTPVFYQSFVKASILDNYMENGTSDRVRSSASSFGRMVPFVVLVLPFLPRGTSW